MYYAVPNEFIQFLKINNMYLILIKGTVRQINVIFFTTEHKKEAKELQLVFKIKIELL